MHIFRFSLNTILTHFKFSWHQTKKPSPHSQIEANARKKAKNVQNERRKIIQMNVYSLCCNIQNLMFFQLAVHILMKNMLEFKVRINADILDLHFFYCSFK